MKIVVRKPAAPQARRRISWTKLAEKLLPQAKILMADSKAFGITPREFCKKHPGHDLIHYHLALAQAGIELGAKLSWTEVRPKCDGAAQECRYHLSSPEPQDAIAS